jgi:hypothetical protein
LNFSGALLRLTSTTARGVGETPSSANDDVEVCSLPATHVWLMVVGSWWLVVAVVGDGWCCKVMVVVVVVTSVTVVVVWEYELVQCSGWWSLVGVVVGAIGW